MKGFLRNVHRLLAKMVATMTEEDMKGLVDGKNNGMSIVSGFTHTPTGRMFSVTITVEEIAPVTAEVTSETTTTVH